jgi:hypothetical protein
MVIEGCHLILVLLAQNQFHCLCTSFTNVVVADVEGVGSPYGL